MEFPSDLMSRSSGFLQFTCNNENGKGESGTVRLPLPPSLTFTDGMSYDNINRGAAMAMLMDGKSLDDVGAGLREYGAKFDGLSLEMAADISGKLMAKMGVKTAQLRKNISPNPNTRALFKNPNLREFEFAFELVATESSDKLLIENILDFFRINMYPADENSEIPLMYVMPNLFTVEAYLLTPKGVEKQLKNFKMKPCYLTAVSTTLNGNAILAEDGKNPFFAKTDLSMSFMEQRTLVSKDIREGF